MHEIKSKGPRWQTLTYLISPVLFLKNSCFHWRRQLFRKNVIVEEGLDAIDIDDIGNLEDSPRLKLIDEECEDLIVVNDGGERTRNVNQKKKSEV